MSLDLKRLKKVQTYAKDIVGGFLRQEYDAAAIPELIFFICLNFYYMAEHFLISGERITISADKLTINSTTSGQKNGATCYGSTIIKSNQAFIHRWKFKIWVFSGSIGIDKADCKHLDENYFFTPTPSHSYSFSAFAQKLHDRWRDKYGSYYGCGDEIEMILDLKKRELSYKINNKSQGVAFSNIIVGPSVNYRLAVFMSEKKHGGDSISMLSYSCEEY